MAVYVDKMQHPAKVWDGKKWIDTLWSHMVADTEQELDEFAAKIHLAKRHKQDPRRMNVSALHYDVTEGQRQKAIELGAVELARHDFVIKVRELKANGYGK